MIRSTSTRRRAEVVPVRNARHFRCAPGPVLRRVVPTLIRMERQPVAGCYRAGPGVALRIMRILGPLVVSVVALGCGTGAEWSPKYPKQPDYPQVVDVASRVRHPLPECSRIGVVHADGEPEEVIPALAREAADHGGTHYTLEGDDTDNEVVTRGSATTVGGTTFSHSRIRIDSTRYVWAIVYRCRDDVHAPSDSD